MSLAPSDAQAPSLALLFGIGVYERGDDAYASLSPRVENNLASLAQLLKDEVGFTHVKSFINPVRADILDTLESFRLDDPYVDTLFVYYCGHGDVGSGEYYLTGRDSFSRSKGSCLLFKEFEREFLRYPARRRILILDSCFSARALDSALSDGNAVIAANVERLAATVQAEYDDNNEKNDEENDDENRGLFVFASSDRDKSSSTKSADGDYTAFTGLFIETLAKGIARVKREYLTLDDVASHIEQTARLNKLPVPVTSDKYKLGAKRFVKNKGFIAAQGIRSIGDRNASSLEVRPEYSRAPSGQPIADLVPRHSVGGALDRYLSTQSLMTIWGIPVFIAAVLIWSSNFFGLDEIHAPALIDGVRGPCSSVGKEVGIWYAPNWFVVYLILFPLYLICISLLSRNMRRMLDALSAQGMLLGDAGIKPAPARVQAALSEELRSNNLVFWLLIATGTIFALGGWIPTSGKALWEFQLNGQIIDWTTVVVACNKSHYQYSVLIYTLLAYMWMGICLFAYLACLFLGFIYSLFLLRISAGQGESGAGSNWRLVLRNESLCRHFSEFYLIYFMACVLGLLAGLCMRLEASYLFSDKLDIFSFWLTDLQWISSLFLGARSPAEASAVFQTPGTVNQTLYTGAAVTVVTGICLIGAGFTLYFALKNARENAASASGPMVPGKTSDAKLSGIQTGGSIAASFIPSVVPQPWSMTTIVVGIIYGTIFPYSGFVTSIVVLTGAMFALKRIITLRGIPATGASA